MSLIFSRFSSHSSFPFNVVVVFDFMVLGDISFVMLISVWSYGFSFTYCCCCLIIYIYVSCFLNYVFYSLYLCLLLLLSLWCLSFVHFLPFFVLVLNNQDEKWFFFIFLKKRGPAFWESAGVRELNNIILYHTSAFWAKRRYANIILFSWVLFPAFYPLMGVLQNADVPRFDGIFIGVLPKRRSVIPPENSADSKPNKTPIRAPFL